MILDEIKKIDSSPRKVREFGWVMAVFFGLLGACSSGGGNRPRESS